jgi:hypothetical protein
MAAHIYTALQQIEDDIERLNLNLFEHLDAALRFSCWTEELELDEYLRLRNIVDDRDEDALVAFVAEMKPLYEDAWTDLRQPKTREEWLQRKYNL